MWSATVTHAATASILIATLAVAAHSDSAAAADVESFPPVSKSGKAVAFRIDGVEPAAIKRATARLRVRDRRGTAPRRMSRRIPVRRVRAAAGTGRRLRVRPRAEVVSARLRVRKSNPRPAPAPDTEITSGPTGTITTGSAGFEFRATTVGASFECSLDSGVWEACSSPKSYPSLANGIHAFAVRARTSAGAVDASPASLSFTVEAGSPSPPPPAGCAVDPATMTAAGCSLLTADTGAPSDPLSVWRRIDCANASRLSFVTSGGDPAPTATGQSQGNSSYRQLTVLDGDAAYAGTYYSERCELGKNNLSDTFQLYREGQRRITFASFRLPQSYPLDVDSWHQVVLQMKQTQPTNNGGGTPIIGLHAIGGRWKLNQSNSAGPSSRASTIWSTPAQKGVWTRVAFDITYSQDSDLGRIKLYIDANGDGDALDSGEQSPTISTYTLKYETAGTDTSIPVGESIPSHLRVGPYRNPDLDCPASGCSVQVDNVEVSKP